ncbi:MAG: hypothetical protein EBU33_04995 [Sphingobacteriia bacterium]|nr:hypothetical protein [Sphingobacteriia bacterium]
MSRNHKDSINAHFYDKRLQFKTGLKKLKKSTFRAAARMAARYPKNIRKFLCMTIFFYLGSRGAKDVSLNRPLSPPVR